ncbi:MAG: hypothetical protein HFJ57_00525 [Clostridia bacterium]|nr:hypothetical protein [Clostridia bacterium]
MKRKMSFLLATMMLVCSMFSTTAFAAEPENASAVEAETEDSVIMRAGAETWYTGSAMVGEFTMTGRNTTPVKTMGNSGTLSIFGFYSEFIGETGPVTLTVQIKEAYTGKVLASTVANNQESRGFAVSTNVTAGQKVQIYFKTNEGSRKVDVGYGYTLK